MSTAPHEPDEKSLAELGWAALPPSYGIPAAAPTLEEARAYCRRLVQSHYENFHVASWFLPKKLRPHFDAVYAYCRISDDLGDEVGVPAQSLALLNVWGRELDACYEGRARHPVFVALKQSIDACSIPKKWFADLLTAFRRDQTVNRYETLEDVADYCRYSAVPVGRLVLEICGEAKGAGEAKLELSDTICCALQLANFWQDVRRDYAKGRIYIPQSEMRRHGVAESVLAEGRATEGFRALLRHLVLETRPMFARGGRLCGLVERELAIDIDLFVRGGQQILQAIERQNFDVLSSRPVVTKAAKLKLLAQASGARAFSFFGPAREAVSAAPTAGGNP